MFARACDRLHHAQLSSSLGSRIVAVAVIVPIIIIIIITVIIIITTMSFTILRHGTKSAKLSFGTYCHASFVRAAGFKAVVPGHGAAGIEQGQQAIDIMDTGPAARRGGSCCFFIVFMFHGSGLCQTMSHKCSMISPGARRHQCSVFPTGWQA